ncbi:hypothetical protein RUM43_006170 [Polyplax serrata]|uniref:Dihydrolipoamide acetyltransferase component of pyruvate dehydrogenase complex n=1 Tax=Polyplax serrata TaxID=468196 RepID=A0AAN8RV74_POLSC
MPSLSPTMMEGKIIKWLKKEGDVINPGDVICDIETDKAVVAMEVEDEGILAKILVPANSGQIKVGTLIALMVAEGEDWKNVDIPSGVTPSATLDSTNSSPEVSSGGTPAISVTMPSLSPTMTFGTIVKWLKKEGDTIVPGDVLCDIQTDKAVMALETEEEGILAKILVPEDTQNVKVGTLIALIVGEGEDWRNVQVNTNMGEKAAKSKSEIPPNQFMGNGSSDVRGKSYGPAVKTLLANYQIQPGLIKPTGKGNRILKEDVLNYINDNKVQKKPHKPQPVATAQTQPSPSQRKTEGKSRKTELKLPKYNDIEISNIRQTIARRLLQSKREIPHSYSVTKCNITNMMKAKNEFTAAGMKVSMNDLLTKSTAMALQMYPKANSICINNEIKQADNIDVCVAVATDSGLFTPIIKSTNSKSVALIAQEIRDLGTRAKSGKLKPEEFIGGTFTISNLGMFGIKQFTAIINPPQCGILAIGNASNAFDHNMENQSYVMMTLSFDRRAMDDREAAEFLETLKYMVENPNLVLMKDQVSREMSL